MRPEYPPWDITPEAQEALSRRMDGAMYEGVPSGADVEDIVSELGRDAVVAAMSGTTDRSTREWKNARDRLSRYRRGARRPNEENRGRLRGAAEAGRRSEIRGGRRAHVTLNATVITSSKSWGKAEADLTGSDLSDFLEARETGDDVLAAQIVFDAYGMDPDLIMSIDDIDDFRMTWG
jgi:hypothetical protein